MTIFFANNDLKNTPPRWIYASRDEVGEVVLNNTCFSMQPISLAGWLKGWAGVFVLTPYQLISKWSKITFIFLTGITINWPGINQKFIFSFNSNYQQFNSNYQQL